MSSSLPFGQGPFREVRLLIDGKVAGVAFPYPIIFTGGLYESLGVEASNYDFQRPANTQNVTQTDRRIWCHRTANLFIGCPPFIPILADRKPHLFTIDVASAENDRAILQNWYVSGLIQVITDSSNEPATGEITVYYVSPFAVHWKY